MLDAVAESRLDPDLWDAIRAVPPAAFFVIATGRPSPQEAKLYPADGPRLYYHEEDDRNYAWR